MKGSIRLIAGLLIAYAGVGTIDQSISNSALGLGMIVSIIGLSIMFSGVKALQK